VQHDVRIADGMYVGTGANTLSRIAACRRYRPAGRIAVSNAPCENREVETIPGAGRRNFPLKNGGGGPIQTLNVVTGPPKVGEVNTC